MLSVIGVQNRHTPQIHQKADKAEMPEGTTPGKSAESVGHRAKLIVAESNDTTPGAQGRAASMIARMDITVLTPGPPADETPAVITEPDLEAAESELLGEGVSEEFLPGDPA